MKMKLSLSKEQTFPIPLLEFIFLNFCFSFFLSFLYYRTVNVRRPLLWVKGITVTAHIS